MILSRGGLAAFTLALCAAGTAAASETFTFHSGLLNEENPLATATLTFTFMTLAVLPDGSYQWGSNNIGQPNALIPPDVTFSMSDGYTSISDPADLIPFDFTLVNGAINTAVFSAYDPTHDDAYYGYTAMTVAINPTSIVEQVYDPLDPQIIGIDYDGHHIPVSSGTTGAWTYSVSNLPAVPEPATFALLCCGLALFCGIGPASRRGLQTPLRSASDPATRYEARIFKRVVCILLMALASSIATAQSEADMKGLWTGKIISSVGNELIVELSLRDAGSSWKYVPRGVQARGNSCLGKEFPLTIDEEAGPDFTLHVEGSKLLSGCPDFKVKLKRTDGPALEGTFGDGRPIRLTR